VSLVVGLGNPGERYSATRHNVAWRVIDRLIGRWQAEAGPDEAQWRTWKASHAGRTVTLMTPLTFMNLSGEAVGEWAARFGLEPDGLLVVTDDVYLPVGSVRLRAHGSSGGHRGLESIERRLGHRDYARLRIGVGAAESSSELREHVLEEFSPEEAARVEETVALAADAVECWLDRGLIAAMNQFNRRKHKEEPET
jgi:PTH1 family peptidyl-tRNA hydrolase